MTDIALGVKAEFKQVSPEEYEQRQEAAGFPKHAALAMTQLCSIVGSGVMYIEADGIIRARNVYAPSYTLYKLMYANTGTRSSIRLTNLKPGNSM